MGISIIRAAPQKELLWVGLHVCAYNEEWHSYLTWLVLLKEVVKLLACFVGSASAAKYNHSTLWSETPRTVIEGSHEELYTEQSSREGGTQQLFKGLSTLAQNLKRINTQHDKAHYNAPRLCPHYTKTKSH